jgi:hypothetical protein
MHRIQVGLPGVLKSRREIPMIHILMVGEVYGRQVVFLHPRGVF